VVERNVKDLVYYPLFHFCGHRLEELSEADNQLVEGFGEKVSWEKLVVTRVWLK
jgi:hypothetical protein